MKKKIVLSALCCLSVLLVATGCGNQTSNENNNTNNNQNNVNINKQIEIEKENDIDNDIENDTDTETNTYIKEKSERLCQKNTKAKNERIKTTDKNGNEQNSNLADNEFREFFSNKNYS